MNHLEFDFRKKWNKENNLSRRSFFSRVSDGLCGAALTSLLSADLLSSSPILALGKSQKIYDLKPKIPHFEPRAKSVIQLFMNGGPSQMDLFDPKPMLERYSGKPPGRDLANDIEFTNEAGGFMPSPFQFSKHGESGIEVTDNLPHLAKRIDDIALIRSMFTTNFNHEPAIYIMQNGRMRDGRPPLGAWVVYALGTENQNLPSYVVLDDPIKLPTNHIQNWHSGWLPPLYQGTRMRSEGSSMLNLEPQEKWPNPVTEVARSLLKGLDSSHRDQRSGYPNLDARISNYELAARMQLSASDALDISQESDSTREMYGLNDEISSSYGRRCLMARRLVERGVRMVQLYIEGQIWDTHSDLQKDLGYCCRKTDKPIAALLTDLKQRGLLDSTLVVWGGEFGRLPLSQSRPGLGAGRDHNPQGFSVWMAGAGIKGGTVHGATDDVGYKATENKVSVHDFHATILHLLGMNHRKVIYQREGRNERLTDEFPARIVKEILS